MFDLLKEIAKINEWVFFYGRSDHQNLFDAAEKKGKPHIFLDPAKVQKNKSEIGATESITYSGVFMIGRSSGIDELSYEDRYEKYIKHAIKIDSEVIEKYFACQGIKINTWVIEEVINALDYNFDGAICTYSITIES